MNKIKVDDSFWLVEWVENPLTLNYGNIYIGRQCIKHNNIVYTMGHGRMLNLTDCGGAWTKPIGRFIVKKVR